MKPQTILARGLSDAELKERRAGLRREIPVAMSLLDALDREHRRRRRLALGERRPPSVKPPSQAVRT